MNINRVRGFGKIRGKNEKKMIWFLVVELGPLKIFGIFLFFKERYKWVLIAKLSIGKVLLIIEVSFFYLILSK